MAKILVASEAWALRFALPALLKAAKLKAETVALSDSALSLLERGGLDAVVVTHYPSNKPGQYSAPELVKRMRALAEGAGVPIVLVAPPLNPDLYPVERCELENVGATRIIELANPLEGHSEIAAALHEVLAKK